MVLARPVLIIISFSIRYLRNIRAFGSIAMLSRLRRLAGQNLIPKCQLNRAELEPVGKWQTGPVRLVNGRLKFRVQPVKFRRQRCNTLRTHIKDTEHNDYF